MDHNQTSAVGHDVYREGLHIDIDRRTIPTVHLQIPHGPLPRNRGRLIRDCVRYLSREATNIIAVYEERHAPGGAPRWTLDGGGPDRLMRENRVAENMNEEPPVEDAITLEELSELLAEATGTTPEEIGCGADEIEFGPLEEATVVDE